MTITLLPARNEYTANAGQTIFNYTFKIFSDADLNVYVTPAGRDCDDSVDLTTSYTVTGVGNEDGGTITLTTPTSSGDLVTIVSDVPSSRTTDYQNNGDFIPEVVNDDFDRVVSITKKIEDLTNRSLVLPQCQQGPKPLRLSPPSADKLIIWKTDESGFRNIDPNDLVFGDLETISVAGGITKVGNGAIEVDTVANMQAAAWIDSTTIGKSIKTLDDGIKHWLVTLTPTSTPLQNGLYAQRIEDGVWDNPSGTDTRLRYGSFNDYLGVLAGRMQAGETVTIACFGDSTTDGNQTTGWSMNPVDGSGDAVGNSDHNLTAPNAWPAKLETLLRDIYNNSNISTFNAGYSGKRMDDGWANANYQQAVIDNPFYGVPDVTFIGFGLNDIAGGGSQIANHVEQTRILIRRIIDDGTVPVLLTTDANYRNGDGSATRDHKEAVRELDSAKKSLAKEFGIPLIDMGLELKKWIENNTDGYNWISEQSDGLHFENRGHAFKSQVAALVFFNDAVIFEGGERHINTWDSSVAYVGEYDNNIFNLTNNKQGGNISLTTAGTSEDLMTMWVWSECPNAYLVYLGVDNENYTQGAFTAAPSVKVKQWIDSAEVSKDIISVGNQRPPANYSRSDEPFIFGKLHYGLNKVRYVNGDRNTIFYAGWKISESEKALPGNALHKVGRFSKNYPISSGIFIEKIEESKGLINVAGGFDGETVSVSINCNLTEESGIIMLHGQGFTGAQSGVDNNQQNGILLFRKGVDDKVQLLNFAWNDTGAVVFNAIGESAAAQPWTNNNFTGRLEISKSGTNQNVKLFDDWSAGTALINVNLATDQTVRWAGIAGGLFFNSDSASAVAGTVEIIEMSINR